MSIVIASSLVAGLQNRVGVSWARSSHCHSRNWVQEAGVPVHRLREVLGDLRRLLWQAAALLPCKVGCCCELDRSEGDELEHMPHAASAPWPARVGEVW